MCSPCVLTMHSGVRGVFSCVATMRYGVQGVFLLYNNYALWSAACVLPASQLCFMECKLCSSCVTAMVRNVFFLHNNYALRILGCVLPV